MSDNPFDQFDQPAQANPFDQFDASKQATDQSAAQAAYRQAQSKPATLHVGLGPYLRTDTGIPIPHWLDQGLVGAGGRLYQHAVSDIPGYAGDPMMSAVNQQAQTTRAGKLGGLGTDVGVGSIAAIGSGGIAGLAGLSNPIGVGAIEGAAQGLATSDTGNRLTNTGIGGITGAAVPLAFKLGGMAISGGTRTPAAQTLIDHDVSLTPGQTNPEGIWNSAEQNAEGLPVLGPMVRNARAAGPAAYTRAQIGNALPGGATLPPTTDANELIGAGQQAFDTAYDVSKGFRVDPKIMRVQGPDIPLSDAIDQVVAKARIGMTPDSRAAIGENLQGLLSDTLGQARQSGGMKSDHLIQFRSALRDAARGEAGLDNASRATKALYQDAADKVTQALGSQLPPDAAAALQATDSQYAKFAVLQKAVAAARDRVGGPTRAQIAGAIAQSTPRGIYAAGGGGTARDLSQAASEVFDQNIPRTGFSVLGQTIGLPLNIAAGVSAVSPWLRRYASGDTFWQQPLEQGLRNIQAAGGATLIDFSRPIGTQALLESFQRRPDPARVP